MISLVFIGAPGSGKGTLAQKFVNRFGFLHLSTGDMFRSIVKENNPLAKQINQLMENGEYIPDDLTNRMVKMKLEECVKNNQSFILDGYPRNLVQAQYLSSVMEITTAVNLQINDEKLIITRITNRLICHTCQRTYNRLFCPPKYEFKCDFDGEELHQRADDNEATISKRIQLYNQSIAPVIEYYQKQQKVFNINAEMNIEENYVKLITHLGISESNDYN